MTLLAGLIAFTLGIAWLITREHDGGQIELTAASMLTAIGAFATVVGCGLLTIQAAL